MWLCWIREGHLGGISFPLLLILPEYDPFCRPGMDLHQSMQEEFQAHAADPSKVVKFLILWQRGVENFLFLL